MPGLHDILHLVLNPQDAIKIPLCPLEGGLPRLLRHFAQSFRKDVQTRQKHGYGRLELMRKTVDHSVLCTVEAGYFIVSFRNFLGVPRILDGQGHGSRNHIEKLHIFLTEDPLPFVDGAENTDDALAAPERDIQHVVGFEVNLSVYGFIKVGILGRIVHDHRLARLDNPSRHPFVCRVAHLFRPSLCIPVIVRGAQEEKLLLLFVQQDDQGTLHVEELPDFAADVIKQGRKARIGRQGHADAKKGFLDGFQPLLLGDVPQKHHFAGSLPLGFRKESPAHHHVEHSSVLGPPPTMVTMNHPLFKELPDVFSHFFFETWGDIGNILPFQLFQGPSKGLREGWIQVAHFAVESKHDDRVGKKIKECPVLFFCHTARFVGALKADFRFLQGGLSLDPLRHIPRDAPKTFLLARCRQNQIGRKLDVPSLPLPVNDLPHEIHDPFACFEDGVEDLEGGAGMFIIHKLAEVGSLDFLSWEAENMTEGIVEIREIALKVDLVNTVINVLYEGAVSFIRNGGFRNTRFLLPGRPTFFLRLCSGLLGLRDHDTRSLPCLLS